MIRYLKDRAEASRDIESLYGWSREHYGPQSRATDEEVIQIATDQVQFEGVYGLTTRKYEHKTLD